MCVNLKENEYVVGLAHHQECHSQDVFEAIEKWSFNWFRDRGFEGERALLPSPIGTIPAIKILKPNGMSWKRFDEFVRDFGFLLRSQWQKFLQ